MLSDNGQLIDCNDPEQIAAERELAAKECQAGTIESSTPSTDLQTRQGQLWATQD